MWTAPAAAVTVPDTCKAPFRSPAPIRTALIATTMAWAVSRSKAYRPEPGAPLGFWLRRVLMANRDQLTPKRVRRSLGNEAEHAFRFDGVELLIDFLDSYSALGPITHTSVIDGVVELTSKLGPVTESPEYRVDRRPERPPHRADDGASAHKPASMSDAVAAAKHFYLLARASLERAGFASSERAADIAVFETFRIAWIAVNTDGESSAREHALLGHVAGWHHLAKTASHGALAKRMTQGLELVAASVAASDHQSLVLQVAAANVTVKTRLRACALELMTTTLRLDGVTAIEGDALEVTLDNAPQEVDLVADLALVAKSLFIAPGVRSGPLKADPEFDRLWAVYRSAVPWTTAQGHPAP